MKPLGKENIMRNNSKVQFMVLAILLSACAVESQAVPCTQDADCDLTTGGVCVPAATGTLWCAYPDEACSSGLRFSDQGVVDDLSGTCTPGTLPTRHTLTVTIGGSGMGGVSATPLGLSCSDTTCTGQYDEGTLVELSATPTVGQFLGWSHSCDGTDVCTVVMTSDHEVGALFGVPGQALWATQFGSSARDFGHGLVVDDDDAVITVGEFSGTILFGGTPLTSVGSTDIYVAKIQSATGALVWARRFGGSNSDVALDVAVDAARNIYVTGRFVGTVDFGGGPLTSGTLDDAFVLKLTTDGSFGWARTIGGASYDVGEAITARNSAVIVSGFYNGTMTVDSTPLTSAGSADIFVVSMNDSDGSTHWIKSFGGTSGDHASDVAIDGSDNVVLTGWFRGTVNFGGGAISTPAADSNAILLLKLAGSDGAHLLSQGYGSPAIHSYGYGVAVDAANSIFLTGEFGDTVDFTCPDTLTASQTNLSDTFLVKLTQAGSCVWAKGFGGTGAFSRNGRGVTTDTAGSVAISGSFCGSMSFGGPTLTAAGACPNQDVYAARFRDDGTYLNSARVGGTGSEAGFGIGASSDGRFYTTGGFQGLAEFGGTAFTSAGNYDAFVVGLEAL